MSESTGSIDQTNSSQMSSSAESSNPTSIAREPSQSAATSTKKWYKNPWIWVGVVALVIFIVAWPALFISGFFDKADHSEHDMVGTNMMPTPTVTSTPEATSTPAITATPTATPTTPPAKVVLDKTFKGKNFSFKYPSSWFSWMYEAQGFDGLLEVGAKINTRDHGDDANYFPTQDYASISSLAVSISQATDEDYSYDALLAELRGSKQDAVRNPPNYYDAVSGERVNGHQAITATMISRQSGQRYGYVSYLYQGDTVVSLRGVVNGPNGSSGAINDKVSASEMAKLDQVYPQVVASLIIN